MNSSRRRAGATLVCVLAGFFFSRFGAFLFPILSSCHIRRFRASNFVTTPPSFGRKMENPPKPSPAPFAPAIILNSDSGLRNGDDDFPDLRVGLEVLVGRYRLGKGKSLRDLRLETSIGQPVENVFLGGVQLLWALRDRH
jgi:hypothetical protein